MNLLKGLNNINVPKNPMQMLNAMIGNNPQMQQTMQMIQTITNGDPNKAKEIVMQNFRDGNYSKEQFDKISEMARNMGVNDDVLGELKQYIK